MIHELSLNSFGELQASALHLTTIWKLKGAMSKSKEKLDAVRAKPKSTRPPQGQGRDQEVT